MDIIHKIIPYLLAIREISPLKFQEVFYPFAEIYSGPSQGCELDLFVRTVSNFKLTLISIFVNSFIISV